MSRVNECLQTRPWVRCVPLVREERLYEGIVPITCCSRFVLAEEVMRRRAGGGVRQMRVVGYRSVAILLMRHGTNLPRSILEHIESFGLLIQVRCECATGKWSEREAACDFCVARSPAFVNPVWDLYCGSDAPATARVLEPRLSDLEQWTDYRKQVQKDKVFIRRGRKFVDGLKTLDAHVKTEIKMLFGATRTKAPAPPPPGNRYVCPIADCREHKAIFTHRTRLREHLEQKHAQMARILTQSACEPCTRAVLLRRGFDISKKRLLLQGAAAQPCGKRVRGAARSCMDHFVLHPIERGAVYLAEMKRLLEGAPTGSGDSSEEEEDDSTELLCITGTAWETRVRVSSETRAALGLPSNRGQLSTGKLYELLHAFQTRTRRKRRRKQPPLGLFSNH